MVKFVESLTKSSKIGVRFLSNLLQNDHRAVLGRNMSYIKKELNSDILTVNTVNQNMRFFDIPEDQEWRISALKDLIDVRNGSKTLCNMDMEDISQMINLLCTS